MNDLDAKHYVEEHLPGTLTQIGTLLKHQLQVEAVQVAGLQSENGAFKMVAIRFAAPLARQKEVCDWLALHSLKLDRLRYDARALEFVLYAVPPAPVTHLH